MLSSTLKLLLVNIDFEMISQRHIVQTSSSHSEKTEQHTWKSTSLRVLLKFPLSIQNKITIGNGNSFRASEVKSTI